MTLTWMMKKSYVYRLLNLICFILALTVPSSRSMEDDTPRPVIISLPINVAMQTQQRPPSYEPDESAEEQPGEQRVAPRAYDPTTDTDYPQDENQDYNNNNNNYQTSNHFLPWNPGNKFMVLQISDFISSRNQPPNESEEQERVEDTRGRKHRRPSQGTFDFEDYRTTESSSRRRPSKAKKQRSSSSGSHERKMKSKYREPEEDEEDREVYGTDPVVHYMKEKKRKSKKKSFDFSDMRQDDDDDDFTMRDWWSY